MEGVNNNLLALMLVITLFFHLYLSASYLGETAFLISGPTGLVEGNMSVCVSYPPIISPISDQSVIEGNVFDLSVSATNPNPSGDLRYYTNTTTFNISETLGTVVAEFDDPHVGEHTPLIRVKETLCNNSNSTTFFLNITNVNEAPLLEDIPNQTAYEDIQFYMAVNYSDPDNNTPEGEILQFLDNTDLFEINSTGEVMFTPIRNESGNHTITVSVTDFEYSDYKIFTLFVYETNDPPVLDYIGAQTALTNTLYYYDVNATDEETANLTFYDNSTLFNINSETGEISFTPIYPDIGNYTINISVSDGELMDEEIVSFTVTTTNQPPNITWWTPTESELAIYETTCQLFNVTAEDPDGTEPSFIWTVNGKPLGYNQSYVFCQLIGTYTVIVNATDGLYDVTHEWNITVLTMPSPPPSGVSAVSYPAAPCNVNWRCGNWTACSRIGYQFRTCIDIRNCGSNAGKPEENQTCIYVPLPSCEDGVINCHDGSCEVLVDCGGPCPPCPTCSDNIKNQGEEGVDCGGPCPECRVPCLLEELYAINPSTGECKAFVTRCDIPRGWDIVKGCPEIPPPITPEGVPLIWFIVFAAGVGGAAAGLVIYIKTRTIFYILGRRKIKKEIEPALIYAKEATDKINGMHHKINDKNAYGYFNDLYNVMKDFFSKYLVMTSEFSLAQLEEMLEKKNVKYQKAIMEFFNVLYKIKFTESRISADELEQMMYKGVHIIQSLTGYQPPKPVKVVRSPLSKKIKRKIFRSDYSDIKWEMLKKKYGKE